MSSFNKVLSTDEQKVIENNARLFSKITSDAHEIAPLLAQEFSVRLKNSKESFHSITGTGTSPSILGKTFNAKIDWSACGGVGEQLFMWLLLFNKDGCVEHTLLVNDERCKNLLTKTGLAHKMYDAWKFARYGNIKK